MPAITIRLAGQRSTEQLRRLVKDVSEAAAGALDLPLERVTVHVFELPTDHVGRAGVLACDAAGEATTNGESGRS